jgi:hypothetical protein
MKSEPVRIRLAQYGRRAVLRSLEAAGASSRDNAAGTRQSDSRRLQNASTNRVEL